ncbi:MAG: TetR/AcrR family transcriptional regulator [Bacteroides sp.]|nr:TetR/AcrR family transcriptional regulator [Bacteroides sp.]
MKYYKEDILKVAFDEFMVNGYASPIISSLQEKLGMSRGALYRHYKNKDELFKVVVDTYFFHTLERITEKIDPTISVPKLVRSLRKRQRLIAKLITTKGGSRFTFLNFNNLMIQAARYYPGFTVRYRKIQLHVDSQWRIALRNSIAVGEIRPDIDVNLMSRLFTKIYFMDTREDFPIRENGLPNTKSNIDGQDQFVLYLYGLMRIE